MAAKRAFDLVFSLGILFALAPVLLLIAVWVKLDSSGPVFFRQDRVGRYGKLFRIVKFRTMCENAPATGPSITVGGDARITRSGKFMRRFKLDELPQFLNVLVGDMSVVGPRPEVPAYMERYPVEVREEILSVRPGITDWASIRYKDENAILAEAEDPQRAYVEVVMPAKQRYYLEYVRGRSFWGDAVIVLATVWALLGGKP